MSNLDDSQENQFQARQEKVVGSRLRELLSDDFSVFTHSDNPESQNRFERMVRAAFADLHRLGYRLRNPRMLGSRHMEALVGSWLKESATEAVIEPRLSALRWYCDHIGKSGLVRTLPDYEVIVEVAVQARARSPATLATIDRYEKEKRIDPTFAALNWLAAQTGISRAHCLRTRGIDLAQMEWPCIEAKGRKGSTARLPTTERAMAAQLVTLIVELHGESKRSLGWSGTYQRERCSRLDTDLRKWKHMTVKHGSELKSQATYLATSTPTPLAV